MTWVHWALLSALFAAMTAILTKVGVAAVDAIAATWIRTLVVLGVLTVLVTATNRWQPVVKTDGRALAFLAASALATGASWLCYNRAMQLGPASAVASLDKLSIVVVVVLAYVLLGEQPGARGWLGATLIAGAADHLPAFNSSSVRACIEA